LQDKAEDAGGLTPVKDDNEVMRFPDCRTFLSIFGNCSRGADVVSCVKKRLIKPAREGCGIFCVRKTRENAEILCIFQVWCNALLTQNIRKAPKAHLFNGFQVNCYMNQPAFHAHADMAFHSKALLRRRLPFKSPA